MLLIVLPNTGVPLYAEIKRVSDTVLGIPTQCVQNKHVGTAKTQYCQNVALKMNVKLGGMNLHMNPTSVPWVPSAPTIIIGADVTHPSQTEGNRPSVAALVGSMDAKIAKYAASVRVKPQKEIYNEMSLMIIELLKNFYQTSNRKPNRILFYRDGVSEGQFGEVMTAEVNAIRRACHRMEKGYKPSITYIVVQKRHHTRFFPIEKTDADRSGNVMPGTVVEQDICHPTEFDYFLMSHPGLQGTSRPCHYNVLFDENNLGADAAEEVTYKLAYVYARATRAVSIVTPAYYANIVASRARFHAKGEHWSDSESETGRGETAYAPVKNELAKLMWYM
jgi:eukaryotic translation initiation factor 2C